IDGIERDVGAVGALRHLADLELVIDVGDQHALPLAPLVVARRPEPRVVVRGDAPVPADSDSSRLWHAAVDDLGQTHVGPEELPAAGQEHDELAFLAEAVQVADGAFQRTERLHLAAPLDNPVRDPRRRTDVRIADPEIGLPGIERDEPIGLPPRPALAEQIRKALTAPN